MDAGVARRAMIAAAALVASIVVLALLVPLGEVVTLETQRSDGSRAETQLWVVDHEGHAYLRGGPDARWVARLRAEPEVALHRPSSEGGGVDASGHPIFEPYTATEVRETAERRAIHELMAEKYGSADRLVGMFGADPDRSAIVRLLPRTVSRSEAH